MKTLLIVQMRNAKPVVRARTKAQLYAIQVEQSIRDRLNLSYDGWWVVRCASADEARAIVFPHGWTNPSVKDDRIRASGGRCPR